MSCFLRHYQEQYDPSNFRDAELDLVPLDDIENSAAQIVEIARLNGKKNVKIVTSDLRRAKQTAVSIIPGLLEAGLSVEIDSDSRMQALRHGKYIENGGDLNEVEAKAWDAYVQETFGRGNLLYRHGDPVREGNAVKYPELEGRFTELGENQVEFSTRIYRYVLDLARERVDEETMLVMSTHLATIYRISELIALAKSGCFDDIQEGELPIREWNAADLLDREIESVHNPGGVLTLDIDSLRPHLPRLAKEVQYLEELLTIGEAQEI